MDGIDPVGVTRTKANLWDSKEVLPLIYSYTRDVGNQNTTSGLDLNMQDERARLAKAQADGQELKNAQLRGELIPSAQIVDRWGRIVTAAKQQFLALPDRLAYMIETATTFEDRRAIIDAEIKQILSSLANGNK